MTIRDDLTDKGLKLAGLKLAGLGLGLLALASVFGGLALPARAETAKPLMWVVRDADSTIYLFGSIHVMKDDVKWLTPQIKQRFESSDDLWLEVPDLDNSVAMMQAAQAYTVNPANDMTRGLAPAEIARIDTLGAPYGLSAQKLMGVKKWAVGLYLTTQKIAALGYSPKTGVDVTLLSGARYLGKPVHGFETMDQQMKILAPANDAEDVAALRDALKEMDDLPTEIAPLLKAWESGDETTLTTYLTQKMKTEEPVAYQRVIVQRNAAWAPQIETILAGNGTTFIAVGAAHLVGPDSVIALLKAHGIVAEKLN